MTMWGEYRPCRNCGTICDGDVCSGACADDLDREREALRAEMGLCVNCGKPLVNERCVDCDDDDAA